MDFENAIVLFLIIANLVCAYEASASQIDNGVLTIAGMKAHRADESTWQSNFDFEDN